MSNYKVSYDLLRQQSELLTGLATKVNNYGSEIQSTASSLSVNTALGNFCSDLKILCGQLEEMSSTIQACGTLIGTIQEAYQTSETTAVKQAQDTRAYKRDCYKNPVVIVVQDSTSDNSGVTPVNGSGSGGTYTQVETQNIYVDTGGGASTATNSNAEPTIGVQRAGFGGPGVTGAAAGAGAVLGAGATLAAGALKKKKSNKATPSANEDTEDVVADNDLNEIPDVE